MASATSSIAESVAVTGTVKYLVDAVQSSLHANGKVLTFRDPDGNTVELKGPPATG